MPCGKFYDVVIVHRPSGSPFSANVELKLFARTGGGQDSGLSCPFDRQHKAQRTTSLFFQ